LPCISLVLFFHEGIDDSHFTSNLEPTRGLKFIFETHDKSFYLFNFTSGVKKMNAKFLHEKVQELVSRYFKTESELIEILQKIDLTKAYRELGSPSLYVYATEKLGLPDGAAYNLITVARKTREVPALQAEIKNGSLTVSKARRIATVITLENQDHWIGLAKTLPKSALEKEIARVAPQTLTPERAKYVTADRIKLEIGVSEGLMKKLKRVQDLLSQAGARATTLEEALDAKADLYLERKDPMVKAKRILKIQETVQPIQIKNNSESDRLAPVHSDRTPPRITHFCSS